MTVCTNDVALCNLIKDCLPVPIPDRLRDPEGLFAKVVEFEHAGISFAAIRARVHREELEQSLNPSIELGILPTLRLGDVPRAVSKVVLTTIGGTTWPAVVIALPLGAPPPGKGAEVLRFAASAAGPNFAYRIHEHMFVAEPDGS
jgi:hypothetical protein